MPNEFYGDYAITLPNIFPPIGEQMRYNQERQDKLDAEERARKERQAERDYQKQQQNRLYNLGQIDKQTAFDKFKVGQQAIDNYSLKQLDEIRNKALTEYINLDPAEMQYRLNQDLQPLFQWDTMAKTGYENLEKSLTDLNKTYPNVNLSDAYDIAMNKFAQDYMKQTPDGWKAKNPIEIKETDYQQLFNDPEILGQITDDTSGFGEYIQSIKTEPIGGKEVVDKKGVVHSYKWTGQLSPFTEAITDEGNRPYSKKIKSESIDLGGGKSIDVLPEDLYNTALQDPKARASFYANWNKVKGQREMEFMQKFKQPITPRTKNILMRQFAKDEVEKYDISNVKPEEIEKTPKPPSISINVGQQQRNQANELIDGIVSSIRSGDETKLKQLTSYFKRGNTPFKLEEAFFLPGSNKKKVAIQYYIIDDKGKKKLKEKYFQADDPYLRDKIIAEYQQDMGSTVPVETLPYEQYLPNVQPTKQNTSNKKKIPNF